MLLSFLTLLALGGAYLSFGWIGAISFIVSGTATLAILSIAQRKRVASNIAPRIIYPILIAGIIYFNLSLTDALGLVTAPYAHAALWGIVLALVIDGLKRESASAQKQSTKTISIAIVAMVLTAGLGLLIVRYFLPFLVPFN